jgi:predicted NUDIX family NTP pyrophosphohydrolase
VKVAGVAVCPYAEPTNRSQKECEQNIQRGVTGPIYNMEKERQEGGRVGGRGGR